MNVTAPETNATLPEKERAALASAQSQLNAMKTEYALYNADLQVARQDSFNVQKEVLWYKEQKEKLENELKETNATHERLLLEITAAGNLLASVETEKQKTLTELDKEKDKMSKQKKDVEAEKEAHAQSVAHLSAEVEKHNSKKVVVDNAHKVLKGAIDSLKWT